ncbi:SH3 domain-containing protein, partial [Salmonella sp. s51228]|uniref:SH3 domain-containing protein n=1 Tax=Salmonella sp. s51228 TaxID=3159652 RepID=UPI00397ECB39
DMEGVKLNKIYVSISPHPATENEELELKQGQFVSVLERTGQLWKCEKLDASNKPLGQSGYVTSDFLRPLYGSY